MAAIGREKVRERGPCRVGVSYDGFQDIGYPIDTKNCGTRGGWAWRLLKATAPRLLASDVPTAAPRATLSLDVNVARAGDDYDSGDVQ